MIDKAMLASKNAKPTPEEVAFEVVNRWYNLGGLSGHSNCEIIHCGLAYVDVYRTSNGLLFEIWPYNGTRPKGDEVYHLREYGRFELDLPDDFKNWFIDTIDRMYGWQK